MRIGYSVEGKEAEGGFGQSIRIDQEDVYRDAPSEQIQQMVDEVKKGKNWRSVVEESVDNQWLKKIILNDSRNIFLKLLELQSDSLCLDIGAGWGQHTLDLLKEVHVCSVEPSPERFSFMEAVIAQLELSQKAFLVNARLEDLKFKKQFHAAVSVGVLEYVGKYQKNESVWIAQKNFLQQIRESLLPGGALIVGIENRLGLKYLLGKRDDHLCVPNIACHEFSLAKEKWLQHSGEELDIATYNLNEYCELFAEAGFSRLDVYAAFPDYKLPKYIIKCHSTEEEVDLHYEDFGYVEEHDGVDGSLLDVNQELNSFYKDFSSLGILKHFAPSYFIKASTGA